MILSNEALANIIESNMSNLVTELRYPNQSTSSIGTPVEITTLEFLMTELTQKVQALEEQVKESPWRQAMRTFKDE